MFSLFSFVSEKELKENRKGMHYFSYSLDEIAKKAKEDPLAQAEVFLRVRYDALHYAETLCRRRSYLDFDSMCQSREKTIYRAIERYEPERGSFRRLLRKRFFWTGRSLTKAAARRYHTERKNLGKRVYDLRQSTYLSENLSDKEDVNEKLNRKLDIDRYRDTLRFPQQEIRNRYFLGLSFKEIAEIHHCAVSTVSHTVYKALKERKEIRKIQ